MKPTNNRAITLGGANSIFEPLGICILKEEVLGYYFVQDWEGEPEQLRSKTLTELCRELVRRLQRG